MREDQCSCLAPLLSCCENTDYQTPQHQNLLDIVTLYLLALALTIGIELAIVAVVRQFVPKLREKPTLSTCVCINLLTHPLATLAYLGISLPILTVELAVMIAESIGYRYVGGIPLKSSVSLALLTNVASMIAGFLAI